MEKRKKSNKDDFAEWLIGLERQVGKPIVVSLLIEGGHVGFLTCIDKVIYMDTVDNEDLEMAPAPFDPDEEILSGHAIKRKEPEYIG